MLMLPATNVSQWTNVQTDRQLLFRTILALLLVQRFLDAEGVWNFPQKGGVVVNFPPESKLVPRVLEPTDVGQATTISTRPDESVCQTGWPPRSCSSGIACHGVSTADLKVSKSIPSQS